MALPNLDSIEAKEWEITNDSIVKKRDEKKRLFEDSKSREKGVEVDHKAHIEAVRTGKPSSSAPSPAAISDAAYHDWSDHYEAVIEHHRLKRPIFQKAFREYNAKYVKPIEDPILKRIGAALTELHAALLERHQLRSELHNRLGIEPVGLVNISFNDVLGIPTDKNGPLAELLRELVAAGALTKLPIGLR
jgi:hypothetical protein